MSWYIAACLLIPALWGLAMGLVYEMLAPSRRAVPDEHSTPGDLRS